MLSRDERDELVAVLEQAKRAARVIAKTIMPKKISAVIISLQKVRQTCEKSLSAERAQFYTETLLPLENVLQGNGKGKIPIRELVEAMSLIGEIIGEVQSRLLRETEIKKEIWFLPYKAEMWDSLETIWQAAVNDNEHCSAKVMPLPYVAYNSDRTVAERRCERNRFPAEVPVVSWEAVDLKAVHPDVIFIHNPYDDCVFVTSVDSRYYTDKLKECCDKLVYVPYFVLAEPTWINDGTLSAEQKRKNEEELLHFVVVPGVLYADLVCVQSENMRQVYIEILREKTGCKDRGYWEKRIVGIGSPKFDRVAMEEKADNTIPEKWQRIIGGKKVILYNTSLTATLTNSERFCDKLRHVFEVFRNQKEAVLWWRPHPLLESTLYAMRPGILPEYLALKEQYLEEGRGIYDDTANLHRAIACSDAYYGDWSSLVQLYQKTGKPIMIQNHSTV